MALTRKVVLSSFVLSKDPNVLAPIDASGFEVIDFPEVNEPTSKPLTGSASTAAKTQPASSAAASVSG